jgi:hypothetical protein
MSNNLIVDMRNFQFLLFKATDLIGSVYRNGNITFFDRHLLASPVGNRLKIIDLKK